MALNKLMDRLLGASSLQNLDGTTLAKIHSDKSFLSTARAQNFASVSGLAGISRAMSAMQATNGQRLSVKVAAKEADPPERQGWIDSFKDRMGIQTGDSGAPAVEGANKEDAAKWINDFKEKQGVEFGAEVTASAAPAKSGNPKYVNIFGEELVECLRPTAQAPNRKADYCSFPGSAEGRHEICVAELHVAPNRKEWNDVYERMERLQCIRIENYDPFAEGLKPFDFTGSGGRRWGGIKISEYLPKCSALPAGVLDSDWSRSLVKGGDFATRKYTYVSDISSQAANAPHRGNLQTIKMVDSDRARKVRDAVEKLCDVCSVQATSATAKATLAKTCEEVLKLRPEKEFQPFAIAQKARPFL